MNKNIPLLIVSTILLSWPLITPASADDTLNNAVNQQLALLSPTSGTRLSSNNTTNSTDNSDTNNWEYTQSIKYSRGKYGTAQESETYEADSVLQRDFTNGDVYITVPELWQTGDVTVTTHGTEVIKKKTIHTTTNSNENPTINGLGDIAFNGDYDLLQEDKNAPLDVTLTGYIKTPTASSKQGLGTGELDGGPGVSLARKIIANIRAVADASYYFDGKATGGNTLNQTNLDGGLEFDVTPKITASVKYEYASSASRGSANAEDINLSLGYKINDDWRINAETTLGLSKASADQTYLLGATMSFGGGILGIIPASNSTSSSDQADYATATSPFEPISSRILADPLYLPLKSQLYGSTTYTYNLTKSKAYNYAGAKTSDSSTSTNTFGQTIGYGLSDALSIWLIDSYAFNRADKTLSTTGAISSNNNEGFANPTLRTSYRLLDQAKSPADLDLSLQVSPNAFKDKSAGDGHDGTIASGDQPIAIITALGREMKMFTILGTFTTTYAGNQYYSSWATNDNYYVHQYFDYSFAINTQTRFTDRFSINLGATYSIDDKTYVTNLTTGTYSTSTPANTLALNSAINYQIIPNRLVGSLTYTYDDYSTGKSTYATLTSDTSTKDHYANVFGLRADYLF